ncbi:Uncharacterised protein [Yersinia frederiksenii]|uniref:Uncharacterized protein n=1 Tax=Yersinia frederiksenii TaxID=29484 RepID=A0A380PQ67_YERFR|nr:hypothetical protein CRN75_09640 [Yersinia frederiksenii]SUP75765.1 Uncharacterised protein [Yersinia frederiksenii]
MKDSIDFINFFKLSIQRALLGNITHNVRAIIAELRQNDIQLFFTMMVKYKKVIKRLLQK